MSTPEPQSILAICLRQAPALADDYAAHARLVAASMFEKYGPTLDTSKMDGWDFFVRDQILAVQSVCDRRHVEGSGSAGSRFEYALSEEKLAKSAHTYGVCVATQWASKLESKLGAADGLEFSLSADGAYTFVCDRGGRRVVVRQRRVWKTSVRGKPFHQFPARIYVDGVFTTEAEFKRQFPRP